MFTFIDCGSFQQENEYGRCHDWFDYTNKCYDSTCDGNTKMSLTSDSKSWLQARGYSTITSTQMCSISAPWPLFDYKGNARTKPLIQVQYMCQQICDYCPPPTPPAAPTTTTTLTSRCKSSQLIIVW